MSNLPHLDPKSIQDLQTLEKNGAPGLFAKMTKMFLDEDKALNKVARGISENNCDQVAYDIHSFKSSCDSMGAVKMSQMCKDLEIMARAKNMRDASALFEEIKKEFQIVTLELKKLSGQSS